MLTKVAQHLKPLLPRIAFVGGATVALYITRPGLPPIRPTDDVDVIVEVASRVRYHALAAELRALGFQEDVEAPILCRWRVEDVTVDIMPTETSILGFSNRWYESALHTAQEIELTQHRGSSPQEGLEQKGMSGQELEQRIFIRLVTAPHFLATKCEAFLGRGHGDFLLSHDIDDIVTVLIGREEIISEVAAAAPELRSYLATQFADWLKDLDFRDALSGHLNPDAVSQANLPILLQRVRGIARLT